MTLERLHELLSQISSGLNIAVIGDLFLDQWYDIDPALDEPSVETGLTAWQVVRHPSEPRRRGNGAQQFACAGRGTSCIVISFTGEDGDGWTLRQLLKQKHIHTDHVLTVPERMTPSAI